MPPDHHRIEIHPDAPPKPAVGAPCNGCGICCLVEPCPAGIVISRRRHGACDALRWDEAQRRYRCGLLSGEAAMRLPRWLAPLWQRWARRVIAAGIGCDCGLEPMADRHDP